MSELFFHQFFAFQSQDLSFCHVVGLHQVTLLVKVDNFLILHQLCTFQGLRRFVSTSVLSRNNPQTSATSVKFLKEDKEEKYVSKERQKLPKRFFRPKQRFVYYAQWTEIESSRWFCSRLHPSLFSEDIKIEIFVRPFSLYPLRHILMI